MTAGQRLEALEQQLAPVPEDPESEAVRMRADIAQKRASIGNTLEAIQERLSPTALAEQAKSAVREATIGKVENMVQRAESTLVETGNSITDTLRRHPVSATFAGIGLAWLWMARRRDQREMREARERPSRGDGSGVRSSVRATAGEVVERVEEMAERAQESIGEATHGAGETVKSLARGAKDRTLRVEHRIEDIYHDSPLAVGAVALAAGAALGLAIPITRREDQWMGKARDEVVGKVSEMAQEAIGKVQEPSRI